MKNTLLTFALLLVSFAVFSQKLTGNVADMQQQPLENAYILNTTTNTHAHTDVLGNFTLENAAIGNRLKVSILGFKTKEFTVTKAHFTACKIALKTNVFSLEEMVLKNEVNAMQTIAKVDLQVNPVNNSQEILRAVPGLFIGQHAGGGKAEQLFLRGFDVDHGTDVALSVDGMPINMVSHAHGQGYSDLHFMIPETIKNINFGKGPYYANQGDFNTAGYVDFSTKTALNTNAISLEVGQFNTQRVLGMFRLLDGKKDENAYIAIEHIASDGPFESPQNFNRFNIFGKYSAVVNDADRLTLTASHFTSTWDASGQIPERAVKNGSITRFGAIDDTEGGNTSRTNVNATFYKALKNDAVLKSNVFYSNYQFQLFSNFTFFLEDPINGDQIKQVENRDIFGANTQFITKKIYGDVAAKFTKGAGLRYDLINDIELSRTKNRKETLENIQLGNIRQTNLYAFYNADFDFGKFKVSPAVRLDYFKFIYNDALNTTYQTLTKTKAIASPKLNFLYTQNESVQWFLKTGIGFHSNDARVVLQQNADKVLPRAYGVDLENSYKPFKNLFINTTAWYLFSEEEFVYVGDAGIVEPSGKSERFGLDLGLRYQLSDIFYFDTDATYTKARSLESGAGEDYIPLAPDLTIAGGLSFTNWGKFSGGLRYRYLDDRPANEDNSIVADGYFVSDFNINYQLKEITFGIAIDNIFNTAWNETQFATETRLQTEIAPVEEIHFTPGTPFFAKASIRYQF